MGWYFDTKKSLHMSHEPMCHIFLKGILVVRNVSFLHCFIVTLKFDIIQRNQRNILKATSKH